PFVDAAYQLLQSLLEKYPHAGGVVEEQVWLLHRLGQPDRADVLLAELQANFHPASMASMIRIGLHWMNQAFDALVAHAGTRRRPLPADVEAQCGYALNAFEVAYHNGDHHHRPGACLCLMRHVLGRNVGLPALCDDVVAQATAAKPRDGLDDLYARSAVALVELLRGGVPSAFAAFQRAVVDPHVREPFLDELRRCVDWALYMSHDAPWCADGLARFFSLFPSNRRPGLCVSLASAAP
ncbi:MAG: hypothetical protein ACRC1K_10890, partial [Planctomycetia bacterium]